MAEKIAIIVEHDGNKIKPIIWELLAFAEKLKTTGRHEIFFLMAGQKIHSLAQELSTQTAYPVVASDVKGTNIFHSQFYKSVLTQMLSQHPADFIIASHSTSGTDMIPALSISLKGDCITGVEDVEQRTQTLYFTRCIFGGKIAAILSSHSDRNARPLFMTILPGAFSPLHPDQKAGPDVIQTKIETPAPHMTYKMRLPSPSQGSNLKKAQVIVSGGRGIEEQENYILIEQLAALFPRSATGASRPICDYGWAQYSQQVGATGTIVSPKLYIACGISGATQHLEGIRNARFIVAINKDADAPIMQMADVCIVEDLKEFIPLFIETYKNKKHPAD